MRLYFKPKVCLVCAILALGMIRASFWQWDRHQEKITYIKGMESRLDQPPIDLLNLIPNKTIPNVDDITYRRVTVTGEFDFANEVVRRNQRHEGAPGVHVLTPLKIANSDLHVLVNRGFIPLSRSDKEQRKQFQNQVSFDAVTLIKESMRRKWLAPLDPESGSPNPWVDSWIRVDIPAIEKQLPYKLLPFHLEIVSSNDRNKTTDSIVKSGSGREELLFLGLQEGQSILASDYDPKLSYPIPVLDTVLPPGRHLGYVYEWGFMALTTIIIGLILQLRPPRYNR